MSLNAVGTPNELSLELSAAVARGKGQTIVTAEDGRPIAGPWALERAVRGARAEVEGLPAQFRFHDLRHYFASLLIASRPRREGRAGTAEAGLCKDHSRHLRTS